MTASKPHNPTTNETYTPGTRVRVTQQIPMGTRAQTISVEGVVVRFSQEKTGSWYAHSKDDKLWLDRLEIEKDDGEHVVCNLDQYSRVEVLT
jgi:hypothetical protein